LFSGCAAILEKTLFYSEGWNYVHTDSQGLMTVNSPMIFTSKEYAKSEVFKAAENYCTINRKKMIPVEFTWNPPVDNPNYLSTRSLLGSASLSFRAIKPNDPNISNPKMEPIYSRETESYR